MKLKIIALLGAFLGSAAMACPNLQGTYTCTDQAGSYAVEITQIETNGVTTYSFGDQAVDADGQVLSLPDDALGKDQTVKFYCDDTAGAFAIDYAGTMLDSGAVVADYTGTTTYSKDTSGNLVFEDLVTYTTPDGQVFPFSDSFSCQLN